MIIPEEKQESLDHALKSVAEIDKQYRRGIITDGERYNKVIDIWTQAGNQISDVMFRTLDAQRGPQGSQPRVHHGGLRRARQQARRSTSSAACAASWPSPPAQSSSARSPSNFREGLTVLEYFISTHGARKGLADTALKTADSGYLTRKLVDVAQDVIIVERRLRHRATASSSAAIYDGDEEVVVAQHAHHRPRLAREHQGSRHRQVHRQEGSDDRGRHGASRSTPSATSA